MPGDSARAGAIEAVIFDLDGVLADTETVWYRALCDLVAPAEVAWDDYVQTIGITAEEGVAWLKERFARPESLAELHEITRTATYRALEAADLQPLEGAAALIALLDAREIPVAVASQSSPRWVGRTLERIGLAEALPIRVTASEVPRGKPAPDIYLRAAERLGVSPERSLAIEDSVPGIRSAVAAGMTVVQLRAAAYCPPLQEGVHYVVESLAAVSPEWLDRPAI